MTELLQNNCSGSVFHGRRATGRSLPQWTLRLLLTATVLVAAIACPALGDTWTDSSGTYKIEAQFLAVRGENVYLKKANGVVIAVPLNRLNAESQQQARQMSGPAPAADTPDGAVRAVMEGLQSGNLRIAWDALPPSYQKDVNDLVHTFAQNMDAELWNGGAGIAKKAIQLLKQKKEFILGHPLLAASPVDPAAMTRNWDALTDVLEAIINSELADLEKLKTIDIGAFLDGTGKTIGEKMIAIAKAAGDQELPMASFPGAPVDAEVLGSLQDAKISTVKTDGDTATIRIEANGVVKEEELVRVEGKWFPKEWGEQWKQGVEGAKLEMSGMGEGMKESKKDVLAGMTMVGFVLDGRLATQTQEEFNQAVDNLMKQFTPQMGGGGAEGLEIEGGDVKPKSGAADPFAS